MTFAARKVVQGIPLVPATLGNFFLPLMIGAEDVAFPRHNLASYHVYVAGDFEGFSTSFGSITLTRPAGRSMFI